MTFSKKNMNSIAKQKKYLADNLIVENLRKYESNQKEVITLTTSIFNLKA